MIQDGLKSVVGLVLSFVFSQPQDCLGHLKSKFDAVKTKMKQAQLRLCKLGPGTALIFYK